MTKGRIIPATENDLPQILQFVRHLAEYERLSHEVTGSEDLLKRHLFGAHPAAEVLFVETEDGVRAGFALFFTNFSTFLAKPGIYLEDLFILPEYRGRGYGKLVLTHLAALVQSREYGRLEWAVLDWNEPAIQFYEKLGARMMRDWRVFRLTGDALIALASQASAGL